MAFRFKKSFKIAPGIKLNVGKKSFGFSAGIKGARIGVNSKKGLYASGGIPGTGISQTNYLNKSENIIEITAKSISNVPCPNCNTIMGSPKSSGLIFKKSHYICPNCQKKWDIKK